MAESRMKGVSCRAQNGSAYWYARLDGKYTYIGKGDKGRKQAEAAKGGEIARRYEYKDAGFGLKVKRADFATFGELAKWYMAKPAVQRQSCYGPKQSYCKNLVAYFGHAQLAMITGEEQEEYREHRISQEAAKGTIDNEIALLSVMFKLAYRRQKLNADSLPREFVKENAGSNPRRIIQDDEFTLMFVRTNWRDPDFGDVLICAWESAMRGAEIRKLTAAQVHIDTVSISGGKRRVTDYIDLGVFDTKNKTRRTVPVSPKLKEVLKRRLKGLGPEDYVFTDKDGEPYKKMGYRSRFKTACRRAKIDYGDKVLNKKGERVGITFHCMRHTRTTKWVVAGWSDEIIRRATGHKSLESYHAYVKLDPDAVMRLVETDERNKNATKSAESPTVLAV